jgi:large conductance mechanosensitive channel
MRGNVVDLAVGIVAGAAFGALVASIVANIVNPIIAFFLGQPDFSSALRVELPMLPWAEEPATLMFGALLTTLITFLGTMAGVFFFIVKPINAATVRMRVPNEDEPATRECPACLGAVPAAASRCQLCTGELTPVS